MGKKLFLLVNLLLFAAVIQAAPVSKSEAQKKAQQFISGKLATARGTNVSIPDLQFEAADGDNYYVFNVGQRQGFVIVSGDDRAPEILGYSDEGEFDAENIPSNMKAFLQGYVEEIQDIVQTTGARKKSAPRKVVRSSIHPLLSCLWGQGSPYNNQCPTIDGSKAVAGCVATAMAQVMYYHRWPVEKTTTVGSLASTTFNWENIYDRYTNNEDGNEVAKLMHYCGVSVNMDYGVNASSASTSDVPSALKKYFDYDAGARYVKRSNYNYSDWMALIYNELSAMRPVIFGGQSTGGGHAFVCDGYDEDDFFHINWGWSGMSNGYFRLSNLATDNQGTGGSSTNDGYNLLLGACIGVQPSEGAVVESLRLTTTNVSCQNSSVTKGQDGNFQISPTFKFVNNSGADGDFYYGLRLLKDGEEKGDFILRETSARFSSGSYISSKKAIKFGNGLSDGTYQIIGISQNGPGNWEPCDGANEHFIECVINGNRLTASPKNLTEKLEVSSITGLDGLSAYLSQDVTVTIKNSGTGDFHGDITLELVKNYTLSQKLGGAVVDIPAGKSRSITVNITPSVIGTYTFTVLNGFFQSGTTLKKQSVTIAKPSENASVKISDYWNNNNNSVIYGNTFKASFTAKNNSSFDYKYGIAAKLYKLIDSNTGTLATMKTDNTVLVGGETKTYEFEFPGLEYGESYFCYVGYYTFDNDGKQTFNKTGGYAYKITHGFVLMDKDGDITAETPKANVTIPENITAVDLRGQTTIQSITPNSNPNCVYLLAEGANVPDGIEGKNIVIGNTAENISISDGYDFALPEAFTATTISYSRDITIGTHGSGGWMTLVVPFDVDKVTVDGVEKKWFLNSSDTGKHFWIKKFINDDTGKVYFDYTDKIEANTPYIIAVPDNTWGDEWNLTGKTMVFTGTNTLVNNSKSVTSGDNFKFVGTMTSQKLEDIYALDGDGKIFNHFDGETDIAPFQAYFAGSPLAANGSRLIIRSVDNKTTAIGQLPAEIATPDAIYTLDGRKVKGNLKKGVYIVNGKKMIK